MTSDEYLEYLDIQASRKAADARVSEEIRANYKKPAESDSDPTDYPKAWLGLGQPGSGQTGGNVGGEAGVRVGGGNVLSAGGVHSAPMTEVE